MTDARRAPSVLLFAALLLAGAAVVLSPAPADAATAGRCVQAAHRGFKDHAIENSLGSMRAAVYRHADYLEMDVQTTKDGQFVLMHDRTIDRTSRGTGRISDKTAAQLGRVRLNDGQHIPRLRAVLDMAKPSRTGVLIELKWVPQSRFDDLRRLVDDFGLSRVVVDSFSPWVTQRFHQQYPEVRTALAVGQRISVVKARSYGGVMPDYHHVTNAWLASLRAAGVPVYVWKVDTAQGWQRFAGRATMVITDKVIDYGRWRARAC
jgi:glycerophosphoryl diester phosphodiesterase